MASLEPGRDTVLRASPEVKALLKELHSEHSKQENSLARIFYEVKSTIYLLTHWGSNGNWNAYSDRYLSDQYLSHSKEKCELMYMLARLNKSSRIVECGTSFGLSTIYLALAVNHNVSGSDSSTFGVLTIEKDPTKVKKAKEIWARAGLEIKARINPIEGDLLEVLANGENVPDVVDFLFLDAWTSLALPALKTMMPRLRHGSVVIADKTASGKLLYQDMLDFVQEPANHFMSATIPFPEGLEVMIYSPPASITSSEIMS